jgi:thiamine-monophosphate kinase
MDVSDGLFATVRTLCEANGLGAVVDADFQLDEPVAEVGRRAGLRSFDLAQTWGDWGLVVVVQAHAVDLVMTSLREEGVTARDIGVFTPDPQLTLGAGVPWVGVAQERFSPSSWHGGELSALLADMLTSPHTT